jgi:uncharacterized membrane protein
MAGPDTGNDVPTVDGAASRGPSGRMRWALILSLALNLLILGVVGGAILRHGRDMPRGMVSDIGFGPFTQALSDEDRRGLRDAFMARGPGFRDMKREFQADVGAIGTALRAAVWDPEPVRAIFEKQRGRMAERIAVGQSLLLDRFTAMSPVARKAFADRLDEALDRGGPREQPGD